MNVRGITSLITSCLLLLTHPIQANTLTQVVARTLETHPTVLHSQYTRLAADEALQQAQAGYLPNIQLNAGYGREHSENATTRILNLGDGNTLDRQELSIHLSQMLFDGFSVQAQVSNRTALRNSAAHRAFNTSENVAQATVEVFLNVFRREALLELAKNNLVVHQKTYAKIQELFASGAGRRADLQQSESRLALAESLLINAQGNLTNANIRYEQITGEEPRNLVDFTQSAEANAILQRLPESVEQALAQALAEHPALLSAMAEVTAAEANYEGSNAAFMPQVSLHLSASQNENLDGIEGNNDDWQAMLQMNYNLYRGGADRARRAETIQLLAATRETLRTLEREVKQDVRIAWNNLNTIRQRMPPLEKHLQSTQAVVEAYEEQFKLGRRSLLDVLDSENELFNARSLFADLHYAEWIEIFNVLNSVGILLNALAINPPATAVVTQ